MESLYVPQDVDIKMNSSNFQNHIFMALPDKHAFDEIFHAQAHIWKHIFNFVNSFSLKCAIQLGIPDIVHKYGKPIPLPNLIEALSIHKEKSDSLHRLMRLLVHSGIFTENSDGYVLTPAAHLLLRDHPFSMTPLLVTVLDPNITEPWHNFSDWLKTDSHGSLFGGFHRMELWEFASNKPEFNHSFNEAMASDSRMVSSFVLSNCKQVFEGVDTLVDVAGGIGGMAKDIAKAFPNMSCIVLDLPHVVERLEGNTNLTFVAGDMFQSLPAANAFLLKWILHDWSDDRCVEILKRCKEAISTKGKVIIIDIVVDKETKYLETQLLFDMQLMTLLNGKQRNETEWAKLFTDAGFTYYKLSHVLGVRSIIEVYP